MVSCLTQAADNFKSGHSGQHDVQDDRIEWIRLADLKAFKTIMRQHHRVSFLLQTPLQEMGHFLKRGLEEETDRKSTRLNSSHPSISYAVFCLKKKKKKKKKKTK